MTRLPDDQLCPGEPVDLDGATVVPGRDGFDLDWLRGVPPGAATVDLRDRDEPASAPAPATSGEGPR